MDFQSILFRNSENDFQENKIGAKVPDFFSDLNLDQVVDAITIKKEVYNLKPFFYTKLESISGINYRQAVMEDLENIRLYSVIEIFANQMREIYGMLEFSKKSFYKYEKERVFLDAVTLYVNSIFHLKNGLSNANLKSNGFLEFGGYLTEYFNSTAFQDLFKKNLNLQSDLDDVKYCVRIKELQIEVCPAFEGNDYSQEVENTFHKFKDEAVNDYRVKFKEEKGINEVQNFILEGVSQLYPEIFQNLEDFSKQNENFLNKTIEKFDREIQFYVAYLDYISKLKASGLNFCYPEITMEKSELYNDEGFDLALANKLTSENLSVVCNDFQLSGKERVLVITGPNQGGKTTYARTIGQLHFLANIGCPVPGKKAKILLIDAIFTHFEKEERTEDHQSKLESDLLKTHQILSRSTENSLLIMNEVLSSTTLMDAVFLSKEVLTKIFQLDALCVWVTFIDELSALNEKTVSLVSGVSSENPSIRTFKILKKEATGVAYAVSLAEKHGLTYDKILERIKE